MISIVFNEINFPCEQWLGIYGVMMLMFSNPAKIAKIV